MDEGKILFEVSFAVHVIYVKKGCLIGHKQHFLELSNSLRESVKSFILVDLTFNKEYGTNFKLPFFLSEEVYKLIPIFIS